ncbi:MAG: universal stress protein [Nitrospirae bacterium]|nr:universal stress protein [Nitrospirota bacterium]
MTGCRCILAAVDPGTEAETIVSYAAYFSSAMKAPVRLLHVMDYLLTPPAYLIPYIEEEKKRGETEMAALQAILEKAGVTSDFRLMTGRLHESFVTAITEYKPDLMIIGYASHAFRPSSSERLIRSLEMPMLVVRGKRSEGSAVGSVRIRNILCAVDFSGSSQKALQQAAVYASAFSASLHVIHAIPSHALKGRWAEWGLSSTKDIMQQFDASVASEAREALSRMVRDAGIEARSDLMHGMPSEVICRAAESGEYDLVVMGARGLSHIKGVFIGSVTEAVIKVSPCPVFIVH